MKESLVAINVLGDNNELLNNNSGVPFLYYWDGKFNVLDSLKHDNYFIKLIVDKCINTNIYTKSRISFFYFMYNEDGKELYKENIVFIQELFNLNFLQTQNINTDICNKYINKYFHNLYKTISNKPKIDNDEELKNFVLNNWTKEDNINWLNQFLNEENLNKNNIEYIINFYNQNF